MATILARQNEDGTLIRVRTLKPTGVNPRKGRLSRKTLESAERAGVTGARRTRSPYQVRAVASGQGVLMDPTAITTRSPQLERAYGRPAGHLSVPDTSWPEIRRQIDADLAINRMERMHKKAA